MNLLVAKIIAILLFFLGALGSTFIPVILSQKRVSAPSNGQHKLEKILEGCNSMAGGVFLATCFVALLPFVRTSYMKAIEVGGLDTNYPYGELTILVGFFLVVFVEVAITHHNANVTEPKAKRTESGDNVETSALMSGSDNSVNSDRATSPSHHSHHHGGGHSHNTISASRSLLHSIILVITLGVHTLFEGMAIGLLTDMDLLITLVIAVFIHEICCSIALGVNISQQSLSKAASLAICCVFSCMMPVGIAIGIGLGEIRGFPGLLLTAIMQGLATGTFMYVLFMEIVPSIFNSCNSIVQIILMFVGCVFMCLVIVFTHSHEHEAPMSLAVNSTFSP